MISEWDYVSRAKKGDENAASFIFEKHYKSLLRMTVLITGSLDSAKDIVQETFIRLFKKNIKHYDGNFKTYITTIAYRLALKEKYRVNKINATSNEQSIDVSLSPIDNHISSEFQKNLFNTINSLPETQREILVLRFYGSHSYQEISEITKVPIGTVKSRIFYAVKECGKKLKKKGLL